MMMRTLRELMLVMLVALGCPAWAGDSAVKGCEGCHGATGASTDPHTPSIGGYSAWYLEDALKSYAERRRPCPELDLPGAQGQKTDMCQAASKLSADEITTVAEYFGEQQFQPAKQSTDGARAARGRQLHQSYCEKCHADGGSDPEDDAGILLGQWREVLRQTFDDYRSGARPMEEKMQAKISELSDTDIEDLIHFYAGGEE